MHISSCKKYLADENEIPVGTEGRRTLQLVNIQAYEDVISGIYIQPTLVCNITNYVGISCSTLKIIFKKLYNDSQFNKLKCLDKNMLELIFSFLIPSDI